MVVASDASAGADVKQEIGLDNDTAPAGGGSGKRKAGPGTLDEDQVPLVKKQRVRAGSKGECVQIFTSTCLDSPLKMS